jgi:acetoin utilization deacetylase AcuC-like enzyme
VDDGDYEEAFVTIIMPYLKKMDPELIIWACGFDACDGKQCASFEYLKI